MESFISNNDRSESQSCNCCGHRIRLLEDPQSLALFLGVKSAQERAFQCLNCGQMLCKECNQSEFRCTCGCNAWVALPCLAGSPDQADRPAHEPAADTHGSVVSFGSPDKLVPLDIGNFPEL